MATWSEISAEINSINTPDKCDIVRRRKLAGISKITNRNTVLYATDFLGTKALFLSSSDLSINLTDKEGFVEVTKNLSGEDLDVVLHSPGGIAEAAESVVDLLRNKFSNIRFIIPNAAKSAATMLAMSGDMILMDERSELGPTDPQMIVNRDGQRVIAPAHDIKEQFAMAKKQIINNSQNLTPWLPILRQYGPSLLAECDRAMSLSKKLVKKWLKDYMFNGDRNAVRKADRIARYLTSKAEFKSHARKIGIDDLVSRNVKILDLRTDPTLQEAIWDLYLALQFTFSMTGAFKIFENNNSEALIRQVQIIQQLPSLGQPQPTNSQRQQLQAPATPRTRRSRNT